MKKVILAALTAATILPRALMASAPIFSRAALGGTVLGGIAGHNIRSSTPMCAANALFGR